MFESKEDCIKKGYTEDYVLRRVLRQFSERVPRVLHTCIVDRFRLKDTSYSWSFCNTGMSLCFHYPEVGAGSVDVELFAKGGEFFRTEIYNEINPLIKKLMPGIKQWNGFIECSVCHEITLEMIGDTRCNCCQRELEKRRREKKMKRAELTEKIPVYHGYVYFIQGKTSRNIKIGYSINPDRRLIELQTHSPEQMKELARIPAKKTLEKRLHRQFRSYLVPGKREWFYPKRIILKYIKRVNEKAEEPHKIKPKRRRKRRTVTA